MIVTLTTDFGLSDGYVAAMKGTMLSVSPALTFVDVSHRIPAQDVMEAAFVLRQAVPGFPADTVHLVVVDPGVGTERRALAARFHLDGRGHWFVGPDNGVLPLLAGEAVEALVELDRPEAWARPEASDTFHGRDVFGPIAAALASGTPLDHLGTAVDAPAAMHWPLPRTDAEGVGGMVLHVDRFGNCITNITRADLDGHRDGRPFKCYAGSTVIQTHARTYAETSAGDPLTLFGSSGLLEIAVNCGHASRLLSIERGAPVSVVYGSVPRDAPGLAVRAR